MSEYKSNPIIRTKGGAELFRKRYEEADRLYDCYLGHGGCSPDRYGPCYVETMNIFFQEPK